MYTRYDVHVDQPANSIRRELLDPPERWLPPSVHEPTGDGRYLARVGFDAPGAHISKQVELTVGTARVAGDWLEIPVGWRATGPGQLFPVMEGKLTVQPLGAHSAIVWFGGTYQPPLAGPGKTIDEVLMHRVAEATIRDFVEGVAGRLSALAANRPG